MAIKFINSKELLETLILVIKSGYNLDNMRQSACLVVNQITVYSYVFLFILHIVEFCVCYMFCCALLCVLVLQSC